MLYASGVLDLLQACMRRRRLASSSKGSPIYPFCVLIYHRVNPDEDDFFPAITPELFDAQLGYLARNCHVLSLGEIVKRLKHGAGVDPLTVAITFDDGYRDNFTYAMPILKKHGLPATLFAATAFIGSGRVMWNDQVAWAIKRTTCKAYEFQVGERHLRLGFRTVREKKSSLLAVLDGLKRVPETEKAPAVGVLKRALGCGDEGGTVEMLKWSELREMAREGWEIGSHTVNHCILSRISAEAAARELRESKILLEKELSLPVKLFAYPNGKATDFNGTVKRLIQETGYQAAVTTIDGLNGAGLDFLEIQRGDPWESNLPHFAAKLTYKYWKSLRPLSRQ
jgi:peptidoglycan/xylan/chitin deacetylase (PgdA/CDA1 family)